MVFLKIFDNVHETNKTIIGGDKINMVIERESFILQKIYEKKRVKVNELAEALKVTPETIRKDLTEMEDKNLLKRVHGGAVALTYFKSMEPIYSKRSVEQIDAKQTIASEVAKDILPGETIIVDNGSTCYEFAKSIIGIPGLTVITPSVKVALLLSESATISVFLLGGWLRPTEPSTKGDVTLSTLKDFHVNKTILSSAGVSAEFGLTEYLEEDVVIKRQAMECAEKVIVIADHTKFDLTALITVVPIEEVDEIYVDSKVDDEKLAPIKDKGVLVIKAKDEDNDPQNMDKSKKE
jgi:DeoR/GlpR family transcriptional regulator of sugar metabolism